MQRYITACNGTQRYATVCNADLQGEERRDVHRSRAHKELGEAVRVRVRRENAAVVLIADNREPTPLQPSRFVVDSDIAHVARTLVR